MATAPTPSSLELARGLVIETYRTLFPPDATIELRILNVPRQGTVSGYFDNSEAFTKAAIAWSGNAPGVYVTLNPCTPALLARSVNRLQSHAKQTTNDSDTLQRRWFPLDFDPVRPAGISSTDQEHEAAIARAEVCTAWLSERGWPTPVAADSGNGGHRLYRIDLPNDNESRDLLKRCLESLAFYFTDDAVALDVSVFNAARIWKVYGTMACKGDNLPERPHRLSQLLSVPETQGCVTREQLDELAALCPQPAKAPTPRDTVPGASFDLRQWIAAHGLQVATEGAWGQGGYKWVLNPCPWNEAHANRAAFIVQHSSGAIAAGCHHNGCQGNDWHALRALYEPGWTPYQERPVQEARARHTTYDQAHEDVEQQGHGQTPPRLHPIFVEAADVEEEEIAWLWPPYVARKKLHALDGDPGIGKTMWALQLAASVSCGHPMPDQMGKVTLSTGTPARVLLIGMEDGLGDTVIKRLKRAGADLSKITIVNEMDDDGRPRPFLLSDLETLEQYMEEKRPALVYIDSLQAVLGGKVDINRANQVTEILLPLRKFAEHYSAAIIFTRHPAKPGQNIAKLIHRGMGSQAFIGSARLGIFVEECPGDPTKVLLVQSKSNAGDMGRTQIFSKRGGTFEWCGVTRVNKEMMAGHNKGPSPQAFIAACLWLEARLRDGRSYEAKELQDEMKEEGFAHGVSFAAKKALGVIHTKTPAGTFSWHLPPLSTPSTSTTSSTSSTSSTSYSSNNSISCDDNAQPVDVYEVSEVVDVYDVDGVVIEAPAPPATDCYPPPCPHTETRTETMLDGSQLVRCVACQRPVRTSTTERS